MWVSGSGGLCLSLPGTRKQAESPELSWLLHSPVELLAAGHRPERVQPFPGCVGAK